MNALLTIRQYKYALVLAFLILPWGASSAGAGDGLAQPTGKVILQITGAIENKNGADAASFDHEMLEQIGMMDVQTSTPWTEGQPVFNGVRMSDLLAHVGASGETIFAVALNDYKVEIPIADFKEFPVILASAMDGERLKVRDKGPLWIIYPQDDHEELKTKETQSKWVWQVKELRVQ